MRNLMLLGLAAVASGASAATFQITFTNLGPQPLSPIFVSAGNNNFDIFTSGTAASNAIESIAEMGNVAPMVALASSAQLAGNVSNFGVIHPGSPLTPGMTSSITIDTTTSHRWLSFAAMLGMSNDGFIGSAVGLGDGQIDLFQGGHPLNADFTISYLDAWDAGTEENTEATADIGAFGGTGSPTDSTPFVHGPHAGILGIGDPRLVPVNWYGRDIARVQIQSVPEPMSIMGMAAGVLAFMRRRKK